MPAPKPHHHKISSQNSSSATHTAPQGTFSAAIVQVSTPLASTIYSRRHHRCPPPPVRTYARKGVTQASTPYSRHYHRSTPNTTSTYLCRGTPAPSLPPEKQRNCRGNSMATTGTKIIQKRHHCHHPCHQKPQANHRHLHKQEHKQWLCMRLHSVISRG